ncbi:MULTISPECIES: ABC transporter permease [Clostridium]|uniref:ABC transporter permease n=1 Tax=Clostridium TaxID=1485 RepID=UPI00069FD12F|nr:MULTISPECIES: ABC transporter permease subunit [Clostridium]KOF56043.1 ABC transporter permease [Clostridium sp. DMHC 10]MCD2345524.1 ABC transporter permease subunit [Clostridium guangxiense]
MKGSITRDNKKILNKFVVLLFWIGVWQVIYLLINNELYVPAPISVLKALKVFVFKLEFWKSVEASMLRTLAGIVISIVLGIIFGIICSVNKFIYELMNPMVIAIKTTPIMSFIIIALVWFSSNNVNVFICFLMCFPLIWTNIIEGIRNVDENILEMAKLYKVKKVMIFNKIYVPCVIPYFSAACISSIGLGWKASIAAEVLSNPKYSIGGQLYNAKLYMDSDELFAWTFVVIVISIALESLFKLTLKDKFKY